METALLSPRGLFVGLTTLDLVYRVDRLPGVDEKVRAQSQELVAGGPAANAAVTYAALGGAAILASAVGRHPLAVAAVEDLAQHGVSLLDETPHTRTPLPVATAAVLDASGERSVVSVGATTSGAEPTDALADLAARAGIVLVDGHHPRLGLAAARAARAIGVPVVLDAGSWKPALAELLHWVDVAVCSAGFRPPGVKSHRDVGAALHRFGVSRVAVTHGGGPVEWDEAGASGQVEVEQVGVLDTLGAGDAFHGALAWALATRPSAGFASALGLAASVATLRCSFAGQRAWLTSPDLARCRDSWLYAA